MTQLSEIIGGYIAGASVPALLIIKSTLLLALGSIVALGLSRRSASTRYTVWALTLAAIVALPIGMIGIPDWNVTVRNKTTVAGNSGMRPIPTATTKSDNERAPLTSVSELSSEVTSSMRESLPAEFPLYMWIAGAAVILLRIIVGRISIAVITRRAANLDDERWKTILEREMHLLAIDHPVRLLATRSLSSPVAAGVRSPVILLPRDADAWNDEHATVVLRHELAHIARGDAFICLIAGIACTLYWFNPLVWIAARRLRSEQEKSCDDRVIALGISAPDYASHLLDVARSAAHPGIHGFVSLAMARPSQLEGRLMAILHEHDRSPMKRSRRVALTIGAFAAVGVVSAMHPIVPASAMVVASQLTPAVVFASIPETKHLAALKTQQYDSVVTARVEARSGGTLYIDLKTGASLTIVGTDDNSVRIRALLAGRDWRNTWISLRNEGENARLESGYRERNGMQSSSHRIEISVPRRFNVRVASAGGGIDIRDVEGSFTGQTGGGEIHIDHARGSARLSTGGGDINVFSSAMSGSVSTGGGAVLIQGVTGGLRGSSGTGNVMYGGSANGGSSTVVGSGSGNSSVSGYGVSSGGGYASSDVTYGPASRDGVRMGSDGRTYVRKSGGDVTIGDAPNGASISTGGGSIRVGRSGGDVDAGTGGGDVTIGPLRGGADVTTGAGDVTITLDALPTRPIKITSGNGTVTLIVPRDLSADLDLETAFTQNNRGPTRIRGDFDLPTTVTSDWDVQEGTPRRYVRARQSVGGGGARIQVRTVNGDIIIRRR